jgi:hypothetical protein
MTDKSVVTEKGEKLMSKESRKRIIVNLSAIAVMLLIAYLPVRRLQ